MEWNKQDVNAVSDVENGMYFVWCLEWDGINNVLFPVLRMECIVSDV